uniref:Uncharacterized protein n=1 Tax=Manihot esculenta TaxID=3983 RepID=A0A2C9W8P8_MANES
MTPHHPVWHHNHSSIEDNQPTKLPPPMILIIIKRYNHLTINT